MNARNITVEYAPIGIIRSPHTSLAGMPIQPSGAAGIRGTVELFPEFQDGLKDLDGFSHIILLYHFHQSAGYKLSVVPFLDNRPRGVFATRAPKRPSPIGLSIVKLQKIEGSVLYIENVDVLDGTPLLDIKPFVPDFDAQTDVRAGWLESAQNKADTHRSDDRFSRTGSGDSENGI
ncbi:MAG: tRNA (N6-threonylcarbamoyladenosine(37)-N6)-methyltransferase TrmO [Desulfosalsimonadaceae bacterium]